MRNKNFFWPIYKSLEREKLKCLGYIHCDDKQLEVYSMNIADLIVRCAVEIEAIAKELYREHKGELSDEEFMKIVGQKMKLIKN